MGCCESSAAPPPRNHVPPTRHQQAEQSATHVSLQPLHATRGTSSSVDSGDDIPLPKVGVCDVLDKPASAGLYKCLHEAVLRELLPPDSGPFGCVLILDERSLSLIETAVKITDLTSVGIPLVENLTMSRQPLPRMPAVYLVQPTAKNAALIANDWQMNRNHYKEAHVYMTDEETPSFMRTLEHAGALKSKLKTMKHVRLDFICLSQQAYILQKPPSEREAEVPPHALRRFFGASATSMEVAVNARKVAEGIINALGCLGDRPVVRYQGGSHAAEMVAGEVLRGVDRFLGKGTSPKAAGGTLLIVDRSVDAVTPLLHQFTYEAMMHDVRPNRDGLAVREKYSGILQTEQSRGRTTTFGATYEWDSIRHEHVDVLRGRLSKELQTTVQKSEAKKLHPETRDGDVKKLTVEEFSGAVRNLPQFQKRMKFLNLHMEVLIALLKEMEEQDMVRYAEAEQNFTTGESVSTKTGETKKMSRKSAWKQLCDLLQANPAAKSGATATTRHTAFQNKLRAVLVFVISIGGLSYQERETVRKALRDTHPEEKDFELWIDGLEHLRVNTASEETPWYKRGRKQRVKMDKVEGDEAYLLSRTVPRLHGIASSLLAGSLSLEEFPAMHSGGAPGIQAPEQKGKSQRRRSPSWASNAGLIAGPALADLNGPRVHVFVVGGVTPAEIHAAAQLQAETRREVVFGGTELLTPADYLDCLPCLSTSPYK